MKKLTLSITALLMAMTYAADAQITLEKDYSGYNHVNVYNINNEGHKYVTVDTTTKQVVLFNTDHTVWKTCAAISLPGNINYSPSFVSKNLFNTDNKIEFLVAYSESIGGKSVHKSVIYNEDGTILATIPDAYYNIVEKVGNDWKLISHTLKHASANIVYSSIVYSLPGQYLGMAKPQEGGPDKASVNFYPNPMEEAGVLEYSLPKGTENGKVTIINSNGVVVQQQELNSSQKVEVKRGGLPAGVYYLRLEAGETVETKKFVMQ